MPLFFRCLALIVLITPMSLIADDAVRLVLADYAWEKRQIIVFSPTAKNPEFLKFNRLEKTLKAEFDDRQLQTWRILPGTEVTLDNQPQAELVSSGFHNHFRVNPEEFTVLLIGYDQGVKLRQSKIDLDRILGDIDLMPMRRQEMQ